MNRDYPLAPSPNMQDRIDRLQKKENKLVAKGYKAVDEGRDKKADRILGRAAKVEDRKIRMSEKKK
jgi:predicted deacetylase